MERLVVWGVWGVWFTLYIPSFERPRLGVLNLSCKYGMLTSDSFGGWE
jgi:hypothetical protein